MIFILSTGSVSSLDRGAAVRASHCHLKKVSTLVLFMMEAGNVNEQITPRQEGHRFHRLTAGKASTSFRQR